MKATTIKWYILFNSFFLRIFYAIISIGNKKNILHVMQLIHAKVNKKR